MYKYLVIFHNNMYMVDKSCWSLWKNLWGDIVFIWEKLIWYITKNGINMEKSSYFFHSIPPHRYQSRGRAKWITPQAPFKMYKSGYVMLFTTTIVEVFGEIDWVIYGFYLVTMEVWWWWFGDYDFVIYGCSPPKTRRIGYEKTDKNQIWLFDQYHQIW